MNILVTGANGQLGNEMRIISKDSSDRYIFTDVNQVEGVETIYLDITDLEAIRKMVADNNIDAIVNCAAWTNVDGAEDSETYAIVEKLNARSMAGWYKSRRIMDLAKSLITRLVRKTRAEPPQAYMVLQNFWESRISLLQAVSI